MIQYDNSKSASLVPTALQGMPTHDPAGVDQDGSPTPPTQVGRMQNARTSAMRSETSSSTANIVRARDLQQTGSLGSKRPKPRASAARAIWNALAIASMATLVGFGYLSYRLNQDLDEATAQLATARNQLVEYESASAAQQDTLDIYQKQAADYQKQATAFQNNYADLQAESLTLRAEANRIAQLNASLVEENERLTGLHQFEQDRFAVVSAADRIMQLFGTDAAPNLSGTLYLQNENGSLVLDGLEPLTQAQTYQLWLFTEGGLQIPANLIGVQDALNPTWARLTFRQNMPEFVAAGINIEPVGGSSSPTSPMLMVSQVGQ